MDGASAFIPTPCGRCLSLGLMMPAPCDIQHLSTSFHETLSAGSNDSTNPDADISSPKCPASVDEMNAEEDINPTYQIGQSSPHPPEATTEAAHGSLGRGKGQRGKLCLHQHRTHPDRCSIINATDRQSRRFATWMIGFVRILDFFLEKRLEVKCLGQNYARFNTTLSLGKTAPQRLPPAEPGSHILSTLDMNSADNRLCHGFNLVFSVTKT